MGRNVIRTGWKVNTIATHFGHNVFPEDNNLLGAVE